jgi:hypothetical protein
VSYLTLRARYVSWAQKKNRCRDLRVNEYTALDNLKAAKTPAPMRQRPKAFVLIRILQCPNFKSVQY